MKASLHTMPGLGFFAWATTRLTHQRDVADQVPEGCADLARRHLLAG